MFPWARKMNILRGERSGISDLAGFVMIILGLVVIPFFLSYQIFMFYYIQTIFYNSATMTLRIAEVGYSEKLLYSAAPDGNYEQSMSDELKATFVRNMAAQGVDLTDGNFVDAGSFNFKVNTSKSSPFTTLSISADVPVRYGAGMLGMSSLPIRVVLVGRKTMMNYGP